MDLREARSFDLQTTRSQRTSRVSEIWATEDIPIDYDLCRTLSSAMVAKQPGFQEMFEEMKKIALEYFQLWYV